MGDELSPEMLEAANDLYHMRIPSAWLKMAGDTAPPATHSLTSWLQDLTYRGQHFERILVYVSPMNFNVFSFCVVSIEL